MIDLNTKVEAKEQPNTFDLLPAGEYPVVIQEIGEWKTKEHVSLKVLEYDDSGRKKKDDKGKDLFHMEANTKTYTTRVVLKVTDGAFVGSLLYYQLNLHPNQPWAMPAFLHACGVTEPTTPAQIKEACEGSMVVAHVIIDDTGFKTKTDPNTGVETKEATTRNSIKRLSPWA